MTTSSELIPTSACLPSLGTPLLEMRRLSRSSVDEDALGDMQRHLSDVTHEHETWPAHPRIVHRLDRIAGRRHCEDRLEEVRAGPEVRAAPRKLAQPGEVQRADEARPVRDRAPGLLEQLALESSEQRLVTLTASAWEYVTLVPRVVEDQHAETAVEHRTDRRDEGGRWLAIGEIARYLELGAGPTDALACRRCEVAQIFDEGWMHAGFSAWSRPRA